MASMTRVSHVTAMHLRDNSDNGLHNSFPDRLRELVQACHTIRDGALQTNLHRVTGDLPHHL